MKRINLILANLIILGIMTGCSGSGSSSKNTSENATDETKTIAEVHGITITLNTKDKVKFSLGGSNAATIDWGDGSPVETVKQLTEATDKFEHIYAQPAEYTIKITGENITSLTCVSQNVTNLDLNVPTLTYLDVRCNELTTLDVSRNQALISLDCCSNNLTTLDLSKNTILEDVYCSRNQLTSLDVSKNTLLRSLYCEENQLTSLDVSKNTVLQDLDCESNQLSADALNALFRSLHSNDSDGVKIISISHNPGTKTCDYSIATKKGWGEDEGY